MTPPLAHTMDDQRQRGEQRSRTSPRCCIERPDFAAFEAQLRSSGYCARPVRLAGRVEVCEGGGRRGVWSTDAEPDGILRTAGGNRREAVCPPCAERYRGDAYQLVIAGLRAARVSPTRSPSTRPCSSR
jgi:hypothetical protein